MDTKGGSLPAMPEPKNPTSMKQLSGSPCGCKGIGDGSTDPDLLMDKVATQLAATPQDGVLQKMSNHNHTHEHLKDLTSRLLNGDQDKMAKFCAAPATSPIHKVVESGPPHGSPQSDSSPEFTLKITQHLTNGKSPPTNLYEAAYGEEGAEETNAPLSLAEGLLAIDPNSGLDGRKRNRAPLKKKVPSSRKQPSGPVIDSERAPVMPTTIEVFQNDKETSELAKSEDVTCDDANTCKTSDAVPTSENKADGDNMDDVIKEELLQEQTHTQFSSGDVVWAKVSGSPWWPGLITTDPESNRHFRQKAKSIGGLLYHLQYFGDTPERGYVDEKNLVLFSGKEQYQSLIRGGKQPGIDPDGKKLSIRRKLRIPWDTGVSQATDARALPLDERLNKFSFAYEGGLPKLSSYMLHNLQQRQQEQSQQDHEELLNPTSLTPPDSSQSSPITVHTLSNPLPSPANSSTSVNKMPLVTKAPTNRRRPSQKKQNASVNRRKKAPGDSFLQDKTAVSENLAPPKRKYVKSGKYKKQTLLQQNVLLAEIDPQLKASQMKQGKLKQKFPAAPNSLKKKRIMASASFAEGLNTELLKPVFIGLKKSSRGSLGDLSEADEPQPHKKAKLVEGLKSAKTTECLISSKRRKKPSSMEVKRRRTKTVCGDEAQVKVRYVRKRKREASSKKNCSSSRIEHETFCVENPDSPSDGAYEGLSNKKSERMGNNKKENVCQVCEKMSEDLVICEGQCCGSFHRECAGLDESSDKVLCTACRTGVHVCFTCKKSEGEVKRCSVLHCGRFYHEACLRLSALTVFDNRGFRCPLHTCLSCHCSGRATVKATKGKMLRCLRCPVSYHAGDLCIAAGSEILSSTNIICTNHFNPRKGYRQHTHVNVSWCFMCSNGGRLLCCESCPAAFHPDCLNITMPDGSWFCHDCRAGKKPKYRDIIWVKLGSYRWWPAEIRHPRNIPTNIQHLRHEIGEFPVYFFGSKDYYWTHQGRVFPYMEGDRASRHQRTSIGKVFKNAMLEAEDRFNQIKLEREAKEAQENNRKPPPYKFIKINKPFGHVQIYTADISEIPKCNCKPTGDRPCSFESECLNRMLLYECHPQVCPAGARCMNQDFTKRLYPETKIIRTAGKGWGLISLRDIKKGEFVNEYVGELIDEEECRARIKYAQENDITHFYMLTIDKDRIIDAGPKGNFSRFMNHSCQPNCETQKWTVNGDTRVGLFAVCDIPEGTELTFNYNLDCLGNEKTVCRCDAPNCSGFLGDRPKITTSAEPKTKTKLQKKKSKRRRARSEGKKESEDDCFRCGDGGELVLCDRKACTKAYHLSCLDRTKRPFGRWDCPWHHCDVCGKPSDAFCQLCPNSFCKAHVEGALKLHPVSGQLCCQEHDDVDAQRSALPVQDSSLTTKPAKRRRPSSTSRSTGKHAPKKRPKTQRKQAEQV